MLSDCMPMVEKTIDRKGGTGKGQLLDLSLCLLDDHAISSGS
jgi:hypothetical protein